MKKNEKRYHKTIGNKIASVYIDEVYVNGNKKISFMGKTLWSSYSDKYTDALSLCNSVIETYYYEYIGVCVSNSRRFNNDWWNGDKHGDAVHNKSTGNIKTIVAIADMLEQHIINFIDTYGYYICIFDPTDKHREGAYKRMMHKMTHKHGLTYRAIKDEDGSYIYVVARTLSEVLNYYS